MARACEPKIIDLVVEYWKKVKAEERKGTDQRKYGQLQ